MRYPISGFLHLGDNDVVPVVGMIVNAPTGETVGHVVIEGGDAAENKRKLYAAMARSDKIGLEAKPHPSVAIRVQVIEHDSGTVRFVVYAKL